MSKMTALSLPHTLALTLVLLIVISVTGQEIVCPYEECTCTSEVLYRKEHRIIECDGTAMTTLPALQTGRVFSNAHLVISNNHISSISAGQLPAALGSFDASGPDSPLSDIADDAFSASAETLRSVSIYSSKMNRIPNLSRMKKLKYLDLAENEITDAPAVYLPDGLKKLKLGTNNLTQVPERISTLNQLTMLDLEKNNIRDIDSAIFPSSLITLYLSGNEIDSICSFQFSQDTSKLLIMDLSGNPLSHICPNALTQLTQLEMLKLNFARLTRLPEALKTLPKISDVRIYGNPGLTCTCEGWASWYGQGSGALVISGVCSNGGWGVDGFLRNSC